MKFLLLVIFSTANISCTNTGSRPVTLPEGSGPGGRPLITLYQCEGETIDLTCNIGNITIVRANFGRYSIAVCNQNGNTTWTTDCTSITALRAMKNMCEGASSCNVSVIPSILGDSCPHTPKYLEVHYYCNQDLYEGTFLSDISSSPRHSPKFTDAEFSALWNQNDQSVDIDSVLLSAIKSQEDMKSATTLAMLRVPITIVPLMKGDYVKKDYLEHDGREEDLIFESNTAKSYKKDEIDMSEDSGLNSNTPSPLVSQKANLANNSQLQETYNIDSGKKMDGITEIKQAGQGNGETVDTMYLLEIVTYAVAAISGAVVIFLILKFKGARVCRFCIKGRRQKSAASQDFSNGDGGSDYTAEQSKTTLKPDEISCVNTEMNVKEKSYLEFSPNNLSAALNVSNFLESYAQVQEDRFAYSNLIFHSEELAFRRQSEKVQIPQESMHVLNHESQSPILKSPVQSHPVSSTVSHSKSVH